MNLLSYPARPINGGNLDLSGVKEGWLYQPKLNGWRAVFCTLTGQAWNRHGSPMSLPIGESCRTALEKLSEATGWHWWDMELIERRTKLKGVGIILDVLDSGLTLSQRFRKIHKLVPQFLMFGKELEFMRGGCKKSIALPSLVSVPCRASSDAGLLWLAGKSYNRRTGDELFEGVVGKMPDSLYPLQKTSADRSFPYWMKHRYAD